MKKPFRNPAAALAACSMFFALSPPARADAAASWELRGGANASFSVEREGGTFGADAKSNVAFDVNAIYGTFLTPAWEAVLSLHVQLVSADAGNSGFSPRAGLAYNFGEETLRAFYLGARIGPYFRDIAPSSHKYLLFAYDIFLGKRFALSDHVAWAPEFSFDGQLAGSTTDAAGQEWQLGSFMAWTATPFQIAIVF